MALSDQEKERVRAAFGRRVRELRAATGKSQDAFALDSGFHRTWLGHVERGTRAPTLYSIVELAKAFDVTPSELLDELFQ